MTKKKLQIELPFHEKLNRLQCGKSMESGEYAIMAVPGGWIFEGYGHATFVPNPEQKKVIAIKNDRWDNLTINGSIKADIS